jgi:hypothetical protein
MPGLRRHPVRVASANSLTSTSGGRGDCPFKGLTDVKARAAGTSTAEHVASGLTKTKAYEAALAEG